MMVGVKLSITRRRVLGAAVVLPVVALAPPVIASAAKQSSPDSEAALDCRTSLVLTWNDRLARYRRLEVRAKAAAETGWFRAANDSYYREAADPAENHNAAFARLDRAEDLYWRRCIAPMHEAAVALALSPAPDFAALQAKVAIMRAHRLHEPESMSRDCLEVLEEDMGRLEHQRHRRPQRLRFELDAAALNE